MDVLCCQGCVRSFGMINVSFLIQFLFEVVSFNIRPCIPNIGAPLKQIAVGVALERIRRELVLHQMLAHCLEWHVQSFIVCCPPTFQVAWPAVWYLVKLKCLLLNLDGSPTDWDLQFDNKSQIGAACFPHLVSIVLFPPSVRLLANLDWEIQRGTCH